MWTEKLVDKLMDGQMTSVHALWTETNMTSMKINHKTTTNLAKYVFIYSIHSNNMKGHLRDPSSL